MRTLDQEAVLDGSSPRGEDAIIMPTMVPAAFTAEHWPLSVGICRAVRARGHFPNDEAALKLLFLVLNRAEKDWKMPPCEWTAAKAQMAVIVGERFARAMIA